ncbi:MAG TPA: acyl-CoA dehydrogenase family protein, partial [Pseudonocardia sp.]|nr:acyl-CoA dehydrogenase family protein [Pseudonocardia sp.]
MPTRCARTAKIPAAGPARLCGCAFGRPRGGRLTEEVAGMAIDFTLTAEQRELRLAARDFAAEVLTEVGPATRHLATAEQRWQATRPIYEQVVAAGWLRKILPVPVGGQGRGMVDLALVAEEFVAVDANVSLTLFAVTLGLTPLMA